MQRFHITLTLILLACTATIFYIINNISPHLSDGSINTAMILFVLLLSFASITIFIALVMYPVHSFVSPFLSKRLHIRKGLMQGAWIASAIVITILLSLTNTFNPFTAGITLALLIVLEIWFT